MENRRLSPWARAFRPSACRTRPQATVSQHQRSKRGISPRSFSLTFFSSSPCLDIGLRVAKAVRGRARFHYVVAGGRKSLWPRIRGRSVSLCPSARPSIEYFLFFPRQSIAIGVSSSRKLFATACKATTAKHAAVRIYETETFRPFGQPLEGHALTVTRIAFSPDDQLVLTVSRDRSWCLFRREESGPYSTISSQNPRARS